MTYVIIMSHFAIVTWKTHTQKKRKNKRHWLSRILSHVTIASWLSHIVLTHHDLLDSCLLLHKKSSGSFAGSSICSKILGDHDLRPTPPLCVSACLCMYVRVCMCMCVCVCVCSLHECVCVCVFEREKEKNKKKEARRVCVCMYLYISIYLSVCVFAHPATYILCNLTQSLIIGILLDTITNNRHSQRVQ